MAFLHFHFASRVCFPSIQVTCVFFIKGKTFGVLHAETFMLILQYLRNLTQDNSLFDDDNSSQFIISQLNDYFLYKQ